MLSKFFYNLAYICLFCAVLPLFPLAYGMLNQYSNLNIFLYPSILFTLLGILLMLLKMERKDFINPSEAVITVFTSWIVLIFATCLPFYFYSSENGFWKSFLEATSMLTTTGIKILPSVENYPPLVLWRSILQYVGGVGVVVFNGVFISVSIKYGAFNIIKTEFQDYTHWDIYSVIRNTLIAYLLTTAVCFLCILLSRELPITDSLMYTFSIISTGGSLPDNIYDVLLKSNVLKAYAVFFMSFMSLPIVMPAMLWKKSLNININPYHIVFYILFIYAFILFKNDIVYVSNLDYIFNIINIFTTTGMTPVDYSDFIISTQGNLGILIIFSLIGGTTGSTTGGVKINRVHAFLKALKYEVTRNDSGEKDSKNQPILTHISVYFLTVFIFAIVINLITAIDFGQSMYWAIQFITNTGMSLYGKDLYSDILTKAYISEEIVSIVIAVMFIIGRIEVLLFYRFLFYTLVKVEKN